MQNLNHWKRRLPYRKSYKASFDFNEMSAQPGSVVLMRGHHVLITHKRSN